jgi:hypothetical protein
MEIYMYIWFRMDIFVSGILFGRCLPNSNKLVMLLRNGSMCDIWDINRRSSLEVKEILKADQTRIRIYFSWSYLLWGQSLDLIPVRKFSTSDLYRLYRNVVPDFIWWFKFSKNNCFKISVSTVEKRIFVGGTVGYLRYDVVNCCEMSLL